MTTDDLDLSLYSELKVNFTYLTISMDNALEDFWLQVSTDGGVTFTTVEEWNFGDEFENDVRYFDEVLIPGPFSPTTQLRFRCDASGNQDWVYIDNVEISGCANLNALTQSVVTQRETKKEQVSSTLPILRETTEVEDQRTTTVSESLELFPNPARNILHVQYTLTDRSDVRLIITDAQGRQVNQAEYKNQLGSIEHQFEVQNYAGGVYWLHLLTPKGRRVQKFVIIK
ncbi:MAG: T9SS type A sorting domain-containing protein [Saprospiraceae bacterium]|nr:T9SS type A sorting domain-containing protein [Saprospiraceae bacterium]